MHNSVSIVLIICLVLFSIYRRVRRNIGWQPLNTRTMTFRTVIFLVIGALFLTASGFHPISLISDVVGIVLGIVLAYYASVMTRYEQRNGGWYFRPNTWIGGAVTALFLFRLIYRFYEAYTLTSQGGLPQGQSANGLQSISYSGTTPWMSGLLLIMFAYYAAYYLLVMNKQKQHAQSNHHVQ